MNSTTQTIVSGGESDTPPPYTLINKITTTTAIDNKNMVENIRKSLLRKLPKFSSLLEFQKVKGWNNPIAIAGGGPSLKDTLNELRKFKTIIAAGSANDYLMNNGIVPTYTAVCDADPISAAYLKKQDTEIKYLVASCCDDKVFEVLEGKQIALWHCHSDQMYEETLKLDDDYQGVGGGCTVGLRSLSLAIMMGYSNIHMFGFDSCLGENDKPYSYEFAPEEPSNDIGEVFKIRLGPTLEKPEGKEYRCLGYQLAQAHNFKEFYDGNGAFFKPTFHGEGLLPDLCKLMQGATQ